MTCSTRYVIPLGISMCNVVIRSEQNFANHAVPLRYAGLLHITPTTCLKFGSRCVFPSSLVAKFPRMARTGLYPGTEVSSAGRTHIHHQERPARTNRPPWQISWPPLRLQRDVLHPLARQRLAGFGFHCRSKNIGYNAAYYRPVRLPTSAALATAIEASQAVVEIPAHHLAKYCAGTADESLPVGVATAIYGDLPF